MSNDELPDCPGWVTEQYPSTALSVKVEETLFSGQSEYQKVEVFRTPSRGVTLVIDGVFQTSEFDEFSYHEMFAHIPLCAAPGARKALIIGGGDGGVLREVLKHESVRSVDICEIDRMVIDASKKYLPALASSFDNPRVTLHIGDGREFVRNSKNVYDLVIVDSSDPDDGPSVPLFGLDFYQDVRSSLTERGVVMGQCGYYFTDPGRARSLFSVFEKVFGRADYATVLTPLYPGGAIGFCAGSVSGADLRTPRAELPAGIAGALKFYSPETHRAAFVLPPFGKKILGGVLQ
jgi:spermidine synthase